MPGRIVRAEAHYLPLPYTLLRGDTEPSGTLDHVFVEIECDDGSIGWGEAFGYPAAPATWVALRSSLLPVILGRDPDDVERLHRDLARAYHLAGRGGPYVYGISGIDLALWDLRALRSGQPLSRLLGGVQRRDVPCYASLLRMADAGMVRERIADALAEGFRAIKLHEVTWPEIEAARQATPDDVQLMVDANCEWEAAGAARIARRMADLGIAWLEEPIFPPDDFASLSLLRQAGHLPIAIGENIGSAAGFATAAALGAADWLQPSVTKIGGITPLRDILESADRDGQRIALHSPYFGPGFWASLHLHATRTVGLMEIYYVADLPENPYGPRIPVRSGRLAVPSDAGLGPRPDRERIRALSTRPANL